MTVPFLLPRVWPGRQAGSRRLAIRDAGTACRHSGGARSASIPRYERFGRIERFGLWEVWEVSEVRADREVGVSEVSAGAPAVCRRRACTAGRRGIVSAVPEPSRKMNMMPIRLCELRQG
jgi:hypothetical protein